MGNAAQACPLRSDLHIWRQQLSQQLLSQNDSRASSRCISGLAERIPKPDRLSRASLKGQLELLSVPKGSHGRQPTSTV